MGCNASKCQQQGYCPKVTPTPKKPAPPSPSSCPTPPPCDPSTITNPFLTPIKTLRLVQPRTNATCFHIADILVFTSLVDFLQNRALSSNAFVGTSSPSSSTNDPLSNVWDQRSTTHYHSTCVGSSQGQFVEFTFTPPISVYAIKIVQRLDCCFTRINGSQLFLFDTYDQTVYTSNLFFDKTCSTDYENGGATPDFTTYGFEFFLLYPPDPKLYPFPFHEC